MSAECNSAAHSDQTLLAGSPAVVASDAIEDVCKAIVIIILHIGLINVAASFAGAHCMEAIA